MAVPTIGDKTMLKKLEWETESSKVVAEVEKGQFGPRIVIRWYRESDGAWVTSYCSAGMDLPENVIWECMSGMYKLLHGHRGTNSDVSAMVSLVEQLG